MSAEINWTFAPQQWAKTMTAVYFEEGEVGVNNRTKDLPDKFKERILEIVHGETPSGQPF
jgi:hypothetical protein